MTDAWPDGWHSVGARSAGHAWEKELRLEVGPKHILWQRDVRLIARRHNRDDALFELSDGRVAEVHITWAGHQEPDEKWPWTIVFASLDEWRLSKEKN